MKQKNWLFSGHISKTLWARTMKLTAYKHLIKHFLLCNFHSFTPAGFCATIPRWFKKIFTREFLLSPPLTLKTRSARPNANYQSFCALLESLFCLLFNSALIIQICMATKNLLLIFWVNVSGSCFSIRPIIQFWHFSKFHKLACAWAIFKIQIAFNYRSNI